MSKSFAVGAWLRVFGKMFLLGLGEQPSVVDKPLLEKHWDLVTQFMAVVEHYGKNGILEIPMSSYKVRPNESFIWYRNEKKGMMVFEVLERNVDVMRARITELQQQGLWGEDTTLENKQPLKPQPPLGRLLKESEAPPRKS